MHATNDLVDFDVDSKTCAYKVLKRQSGKSKKARKKARKKKRGSDFEEQNNEWRMMPCAKN